MRYSFNAQLKKSVISLSFLLLILISVSVFYLSVFFYDEFIIFSKEYLSPDRNIEHPAAFFTRLFSGLLFGFILLYFLKNLKNKVVKIDSPLVSLSYMLSFFIIFLHIFFYKNALIFGEDRIMESLTALFAFAASFFLFISSKSVQKSQKKIVFVLASLILVFALEEISWGQRIFGWNTPDIFRMVNYQNEINIHNIFQGIMPVLYVILFSLLAIFLLFSDKTAAVVRKVNFIHGAADIFFAGQFYYFGYIFLFLAGYSLFRGGELPEVIFSIFIFFYSMNIFFNCKKNILK